MAIFESFFLGSCPIVENEMHHFEEILRNLPQKPDRSRLDQYGVLIEELLDSGWTYRAVARILVDKCNIHASISTIHHFMRRRAKAKRNSSKRHRTAPCSDPEASPTARTEEEGNSTTETKTVDDSIYQRIAALKQQRPAPIQNTDKLFHYDPDKPLRLPQKPEPPKTIK
jgi:IS30 family transposase